MLLHQWKMFVFSIKESKFDYIMTLSNVVAYASTMFL